MKTRTQDAPAIGAPKYARMYAKAKKKEEGKKKAKRKLKKMLQGSGTGRFHLLALSTDFLYSIR
jgi:hypothetical protein